MEKIVEELLTLVEDEGERMLEGDDVIKEYITADMDLLVEEIREKILTEY